MKYIKKFEKILDILQNEENTAFLDKVKSENPSLYIKFLNIVNNKGLDDAIEKYKKYDPIVIKNDLISKKKQTKKVEEEIKKEKILNKYKDIINDINNEIFNGGFSVIENKIDNDINIKKFLKKAGAKKRINSTFDRLLKKSASIISQELDSRTLILQETNYGTEIKMNNSSWNGFVRNFISMTHYYKIKEKKPIYSFYVNISEHSLLYMNNDESKDDFLKHMDDYITKNINKYTPFKEEVFESIVKLSNLLTIEYYNDWYKKWEFDKEVNKYNI